MYNQGEDREADLKVLLSDMDYHEEKLDPFKESLQKELTELEESLRAVLKAKKL